MIGSVDSEWKQVTPAAYRDILLAEGNLEKNLSLDFWGNPYLLSVRKKGGDLDFALRCVGADGKPYTKDDHLIESYKYFGPTRKGDLAEHERGPDIELQEKIRVTGARVTEFGVYRSTILTATTNAAGVKLQGLDDFELLRGTTNIPARIGIRFGFRYEILGMPTNAPITLMMVAKHPPIKNSTTGRLETKDVYYLRSWVGRTYTSHSLDEESDLQAGQWIFEVWHQGMKLLEQAFLVVPDADKDNSR